MKWIICISLLVVSAFALAFIMRPATAQAPELAPLVFPEPESAPYLGIGVYAADGDPYLAAEVRAGLVSLDLSELPVLDDIDLGLPDLGCDLSALEKNPSSVRTTTYGFRVILKGGDKTGLAFRSEPSDPRIDVLGVMVADGDAEIKGNADCSDDRQVTYDLKLQKGPNLFVLKGTRNGSRLSVLDDSLPECQILIQAGAMVNLCTEEIKEDEVSNSSSTI